MQRQDDISLGALEKAMTWHLVTPMPIESVAKVRWTRASYHTRERWRSPPPKACRSGGVSISRPIRCIMMEPPLPGTHFPFLGYEAA